MAGVDPSQALALAAELEQRDSEQAAALDQLSALSEQVEAARSRARELRDFLDGLPLELSHLERAEAEVRERGTAARAALAEAEARVESLRGRGDDDPELDVARRGLERARSEVAAAEAALNKMRAERDRLLHDERAAHEEVGRLEARAGEVAHRLRDAPPVSASGGADPEPGLDGVLAWSERAHAALLVARTNVEGEREQTIREASELASSVLGEPVVLAGAATIRRRLERELGG